MINLEEFLIPKISDRCKRLRKSINFPMEKIASRTSVSNIENKIIPESGNFISKTLLIEYSSIFKKSHEEIIFGDEKEIEETSEWLFKKMFRLIILKNLTTDMDKYNDKDKLDIEIQKAVLSIAETFAEFNLKRYNFLKSDDNYMDTVNNYLNQPFLINGQLINIDKACRNNRPYNEETVVDLDDMRDKIWVICKRNFIHSFKEEVINKLFEEYKFKNINPLVNKWIEHQFIGIIIPNLIEKLKSTVIFKIGFLVKTLIDDFLNEDLSVSFVNTGLKFPKNIGIKFLTFLFQPCVVAGKYPLFSSPPYDKNLLLY